MTGKPRRMNPTGSSGLHTDAGEAVDVVTTIEAAAILSMSVAYVGMLCDAGKLGPVEVAEDGRRLLRRADVERFRLHASSEYADAPSMRQAGIDAGLYDRDDSAYTLPATR
jgi:hypothetical protein